MRAVHVVEALSHTNEESLINSFALPRKGLRQRYARDLLALYQGLAPDADAGAGADADAGAGAGTDDGGAGEGGAGEGGAGEGASMPTGPGTGACTGSPHARASLRGSFL